MSQKLGETVYTARKLNIRSKPSIRGRKLGQLAAMKRVKIDFPEDDWTMVFLPVPRFVLR